MTGRQRAALALTLGQMLSARQDARDAVPAPGTPHAHERRPLAHWSEAPAPLHLLLAGRHSAWRYAGMFVISSLVVADYPDGRGTGDQWHLSISKGGRRPDEHDVGRALRAFGMQESEEDNHHPGVARHFWMPLDEARRVTCECKASEVTVVEPDGYRWTNPRSGPCRGCELSSLTRRSCALHAASPPEPTC